MNAAPPWSKGRMVPNQDCRPVQREHGIRRASQHTHSTLLHPTSSPSLPAPEGPAGVEASDREWRHGFGHVLRAAVSQRCPSPGRRPIGSRAQARSCVALPRLPPTSITAAHRSAQGPGELAAASPEDGRAREAMGETGVPAARSLGPWHLCFFAVTLHVEKLDRNERRATASRHDCLK